VASWAQSHARPSQPLPFGQAPACCHPRPSSRRPIWPTSRSPCRHQARALPSPSVLRHAMPQPLGSPRLCALHLCLPRIPPQCPASFLRTAATESRRIEVEGLSPTKTHCEIFHKSAMNPSRIFDSVGVIRDVVPLVLDSRTTFPYRKS
jgi:hypothetical protein